MTRKENVARLQREMNDLAKNLGLGRSVVEDGVWGGDSDTLWSTLKKNGVGDLDVQTDETVRAILAYRASRPHG